MFARLSLRYKLLIAFAGVTALSLVLTSGAFGYLLREYQGERERDRLEVAAASTAGIVFNAQRRGLSLADVEAQLDQVAATSRVRLLLISDQNLVLHDTDQDAFSNRVFALQPSPGRRPGVFQGTVSTPNGELFFAIVPPREEMRYRVAVLAPAQTLTDAWRDVLPRLLFAAGAALLLSLPIAWRLASSIIRPLEQITHASEDMARGNFEQEIPDTDAGDEVGRLARAFSVMSREVARSHRAMRDLLVNVGHDLRTPLTSVQGFAAALVDGTIADREGAQEAGRVIGEESERMGRLIEDLLYLGRIEAGQVQIEREPVDLADVARTAYRRFSLRAEEAGITLSIEADRPVAVTADAHRLAQVLDNLLDNAFKHTPRGAQIDVKVAAPSPEPVARSRPSQAGAAELAVHNSGSFIPEEDLERVFERFYQLDKARATGQGHGLGLSIAREIVQAHGGSIRAESSPATGTRFVVTLPILGAPDDAPLSSKENARGGVRVRRSASART